MLNEPKRGMNVVGLDLFSGTDSLIQDLMPEDESSISGGRRWRSRSPRSRSFRRRGRSRSRS